MIGDGERPIGAVSWFDAARFANWLHNGGTNGASTETGAYTLNGASRGLFLGTQTRNGGFPLRVSGTRPPITREGVRTQVTGYIPRRAMLRREMTSAAVQIMLTTMLEDIIRTVRTPPRNHRSTQIA